MFDAFPSTKPFRVYLLGAFHVAYETQTVHLPTRKTEALLAYMILHPGKHSRE